MKINKLKNTLGILSILLCSSAFAQGPGGRGGRQGGGPPEGGKPDASKIIEMLDTNGDDKIDIDEAAKDERGKISEDFSKIDADGDGFINLEELEAALDNTKPKPVSAEKILAEVDQDEDGLLNELEVAAKDKRDLMANFSDIDVNGDSQLDLEELEAFYSKDDDVDRKKRRDKH